LSSPAWSSAEVFSTPPDSSNRLKRAMMVAVQANRKSGSGRFAMLLKRLEKRIGAPKALAAVAHRLAFTIYGLWKTGSLYDEVSAQLYGWKPRRLRRHAAEAAAPTRAAEAVDRMLKQLGSAGGSVNREPTLRRSDIMGLGGRLPEEHFVTGSSTLMASRTALPPLDWWQLRGVAIPTGLDLLRASRRVYPGPPSFDLSPNWGILASAPVSERPETQQCTLFVIGNLTGQPRWKNFLNRCVTPGAGGCCPVTPDGGAVLETSPGSHARNWAAEWMMIVFPFTSWSMLSGRIAA